MGGIHQAAKSDPMLIKHCLDQTLQTRAWFSIAPPASSQLYCFSFPIMTLWLSPSRPVHGKTYINVVSTCKFTLHPSRTLQKQDVHEELTRLTHGFTKLGPSYELEEQSLVTEGGSSCSDSAGTLIILF